MVYVKRWIRWLMIAVAVFMSVALYGTLRTHGIEPLMSISVVVAYGVGVFHLTATLIASIKRSL